VKGQKGKKREGKQKEKKKGGGKRSPAIEIFGSATAGC